MKHAFLRFGVLLLTSFSALNAAEPALRLATFQVDATPPLGSPLCNGGVKPAAEIVTPLTARGVVLLGTGEPIVLCAFDWVGIANESHAAFRAASRARADERLEEAARSEMKQPSKRPECE